MSTVLVCGYGAREHAIAAALVKSPHVGRVYVAPGNAGTEAIATNVPISDEDIPALVTFAQHNQIDLTVVGTNDPLALGIVDAFQAAGLRIFGPTQAAARLESSKAFAKDFMQRHGIPTPTYAAFTDRDAALAYLATCDPQQEMVVKVSGLGKMGMGVTVADNITEASEAVMTYMDDRVLGESANTIIIEERLHGPEVSIFALSDGTTAVPLLPVRDYKRIYDGDRGPNTGGVGAYGPPPDVAPAFVDQIMRDVIQPTVDGMAAEGNPYVGVLYAGIMLTDAGYRVLEFNCRFGNPEALILLSLMESDLYDLITACIDGNLSPEMVQFQNAVATTVVMTSPGYPVEGFRRGLPIYGVGWAAAQPGVDVYHHGTHCADGRLITSRGRVLAVNAVRPTLQEATDAAYHALRLVFFEGAHYRCDVAGGRRRKPEPLPQGRRPTMAYQLI